MSMCVLSVPRSEASRSRLRRLYIQKAICLGKQAFHTHYFLHVHLLCFTKILVAMRLGETPVHIPNTMVKP